MMKHLIIALVVLLTLGHAQAQRVKDESFVKAGERVLTGYIRPAVRQLHDKAQELENRLGALCAAPSRDGIDEAKTAFQDTALAFARVEILRFGPLIQKNRFERLYFWPDRRGRALKRVQKALAERDLSILKAENLAAKSVALQGLGGLEFLLFGAGSKEIITDQFRCDFAHAIAKNIAATSDELADAWFDDARYSALFLKPAADNPAYRSGREVGAEIFNVMKNSVEAIKLLKLGSVIGEVQAKAKPKRAALWRSGLSIELLIANLEAISKFQKISDLFSSLPEEQAWIGNSVTFEYQNALKRLREIDVPITDAVKDDTQYNKLAYVLQVMENLLVIYNEEAGPTIGLLAGFNALDGD